MERMLTVKIRKLEDRYSVTVDGGEGLIVDDDYYQPRSAEEVGKIVEMCIDNFDF